MQKQEKTVHPNKKRIYHTKMCDMHRILCAFFRTDYTLAADTPCEQPEHCENMQTYLHSVSTRNVRLLLEALLAVLEHTSSLR
jgi:hypothetical protein